MFVNLVFYIFLQTYHKFWIISLANIVFGVFKMVKSTNKHDISHSAKSTYFQHLVRTSLASDPNDSSRAFRPKLAVMGTKKASL